MDKAVAREIASLEKRVARSEAKIKEQKHLIRTLQAAFVEQG